MNEPSYFEIQADDVKRAADFYAKIFGWQMTKVEGLPVEYWRIETQGTRGGLLQRPALAPPPQSGTNAFVCSMQVEDYDAIAARIIGAGGKVALPKFAVPETCWQGYFVDTEATLLESFKLTHRPGRQQATGNRQQESKTLLARISANERELGNCQNCHNRRNCQN